MIESIIADYLHNNRRLVIPGLGAFLRKEGGEMVFVPFLNKDDGVLSGLVQKAYASSSAEAETVIGQYVDTILDTIKQKDRYLILPFGSLKKDANGIIYLDMEDRQVSPAESVLEDKADSDVLSSGVPLVSMGKDEEKPVMKDNDFERLLNEPTPQQLASQQVSPPTLVPPKPFTPTPKPSDVQRPSVLQKEPVAKKKRADLILIIAIIIAILAVAVMVYAHLDVELPTFNLG